MSSNLDDFFNSEKGSKKEKKNNVIDDNYTQDAEEPINKRNSRDLTQNTDNVSSNKIDSPKSHQSGSQDLDDWFIKEDDIKSGIGVGDNNLESSNVNTHPQGGSLPNSGSSKRENKLKDHHESKLPLPEDNTPDENFAESEVSSLPSNNMDRGSYDVYISFKGDDLAVWGETSNYLDTFEHQSGDEPFRRYYPSDLHEIMTSLRDEDVTVGTNISMDLALPADFNLEKRYNLYDFQEEAVNAWFNNDGQGTIILPTGGGKSIVAIDILRQLKVKALIVVPTLVLFNQWKQRINEFLGIPNEQIGLWGGGDQELRPITVITYDSAHLYSRKLRNEFNLLILDEAHHMGSRQYQIIGQAYTAVYRLALTATLTSEDEAYDVLMNTGFSPIVYERSPDQLQRAEAISDYRIETIKIDMTNPEEYKDEISILQNYIKSRGLRGNVFQQIIYRVNSDPEAEKALHAYHNAKHIAFAGERKIEELERLFERHEDDKIIVFSDIVDFCERISRHFLIPAITNRTSQEERDYIMNYFRRGLNAKIVSSRILDEGVDIADASVGIIIAGSSHPRQFIQRLGRIIRKHNYKDEAVLYEIVSDNSMELRTSKRRKATFETT